MSIFLLATRVFPSRLSDVRTHRQGPVPVYTRFAMLRQRALLADSLHRLIRSAFCYIVRTVSFFRYMHGLNAHFTGSRPSSAGKKHLLND